MADPNLPADADPFAQMIAQSRKAPTLAPQPEQPSEPADPFASLIAQSRKAQTDETSITGALATHAATEAVPVLGGLAGAGAGAELGAGIGAFGGPLAPITVPAFALAGGLGGFFVGAHYTAKAQDYALKTVAPGWKDALEETQRKQEQEHPYASFIGGLIPYTLTMSPFGAAKKLLPPEATGFQHVMNNPLTKRLFGGGIMGGLEAGNEALSDEGVSWPKVAIATGFGLVFNKPYALGEAITGAGARVARPVAEPLTRGAARLYPTLNDAWNTKAAGPGVTEDVYHGSAQMDPNAEFAANAAKQAELAIESLPPKADVHTVSRLREPELFAHWDALHGQEAELREWLNDPAADEKGKEVAYQHLDRLQSAISRLSPDVQAAHRRSDEMLATERPKEEPSPIAPAARRGATLLPAEAPPSAEAVPPTAAAPPDVSRETSVNLADLPGQAARISADIERQMLAARRPAQEAKDAAAFRSARLVALAQAGGGKFGSAEDLYRRWAQIVGGARRPRQFPRAPEGAPPVAAALPAAPAPAQAPLSQPKPFVQAIPIKPIEGSPAPAAARSQAALTGDRTIDAVIQHPTIRSVIDNAVIDRSHTIPYEAGGSLPIDNPTTYVDKHVPQTFTTPRLSDPSKTVTFDTGEPTAIHENVEEFVMEILIKAGWKPEVAYRVAHFGFAEPAEDAWYRHHDIDPAAAEAEWKKLKPGIQREIANDAPSDLYHKEYPGEDVTKARHEQLFDAPATPEEIAQAKEIVDREFETHAGAPAATAEAAPKPPEAAAQDLPPGAEPMPNGAYKLLIKSKDGKEIGYFEFSVTDKAVQSRFPFIESEFQGAGEGVRAYEGLIDWALSTGREFWSDTSVSPSATRIYDALKRRGYEITAKEPEAVGQPRFRITAAPSVAPTATANLAAEVEPRPILSTELPNSVATFRPAELIVDAKRFQFKDGGDEAGVTERLKGVTRWDPIKSGMVLVWQDKAGRNFIVDGHQRLGLAQRIEAADPAQQPQLLARVLREVDGIADVDARVTAALKNIAEGTGTAIDAAKVLRENPERAKELPPRSELYRQALALANLSPENFLMVVNEVVPQNYAAVVGRLVPSDHELQRALLQLLAKTEPANAVQAESIVRQGIEVGTVKREQAGAQASLFGDDDVAESLYLERAKVLDRALKEIKRDKKIFSVLTKEQEAIESAGNKLAADINEKRAAKDAQALQILEVLANRKGPISDALGDAARAAKFDGKYADATRGFVQALRDLMERHELARLADGIERGPAHVGDENPTGVVERAAESVAPEREREAGQEARELFQRAKRTRAQMPDLFAQREAEGQLGLPGTERITQGRAKEIYGSELIRSPDVSPAGAAFRRTLEQGPRGSFTTFAPDERLIWLGPKANASTIWHEAWHEYTEMLFHYAQHPDAPEWMKTDAETFAKHIGAKVGEVIPPRAHEKAARLGEQYAREGIAPTPELAGVFARAKEWMRQIYDTLKKLWGNDKFEEKIPPHIREIFDRFFATDSSRTVVADERPAPLSRADVHEERARQTDPTEAHGKTDQTLAEAAKAELLLPPEVADAERAEAERQAAEQQRAGGGGGPAGTPTAEPPGEAGLRAGAERALPEIVRESEFVPAGGAPGAEPAPELPGGGGAGAAGAGLREPDQSAGVGRGREGLEDSPLAPGRADTFDKPESPLIGKANNVRVENLTSVEEFAKVIEDAGEQIAIEQGGGADRMTDGQQLDLANEYQVPVKTITEAELAKRYGGLKNLGAKIVALRQAVRSSSQLVSNATKQAAQSGAPEDIFASVQAMMRHKMLQSWLSGVTTEWGRAGRAFRNLMGFGGGAIPEGESNFSAMAKWNPKGKTAAEIDQFLKDNTGRTLFQWDAITRLMSTFDRTEQVSSLTNQLEKPGLGKMLLEAWQNGLISGLPTHATYSIGNELLSLNKAGPETTAAAILGAVRKSMGRPGDTVRLGEVWAQLRAHYTQLAPALKAAVDAAKTGLTTALPGEEAAQLLPMQYGAIGLPAVVDEAATFRDVMGSVFSLIQGIKDSFRAGGALAEVNSLRPHLAYPTSGAIPNIDIGRASIPLGGFFRLPSHMVAGIHSFFRVINSSMEKAAVAYRSAANAVDEHGNPLTGEAFDRHVAQKWQRPSQEENEHYADVATGLALMGPGGPLTRALAQLTNVSFKLPLLGDTQVLKFIDPFVRISSNVIEQSIVQRTPLGLLSAQIREDLSGVHGTVVQDMASARMLVGSAYALLIGGLAAQGYVSGSGPSDPKEAAAWRELGGNQPHSIRIGDIWIDAHRLGPMGMLMGIAADMYEVAHAANEGEYLEAAQHLQHAITQNILDESFMRGPSDLIKAVEDPGRYGEQYIRSTLSSFIPYSVGLSYTARSMDPYTREARTVVDAIKAKVPWLSQTLLPKYDIWGQPVPSREALIGSGATALYEQKINRDPVSVAMLDLGIWPGHVKRTIRNQPLDEQQYEDFQRIAGRTAKGRLDIIVNSPQFQSWPNHVRRNVITQVIHQSREAARGLMMQKYPQIMRDAVKAKMDRLTED